jgi:hypothetical protein
MGGRCQGRDPARFANPELDPPASPLPLDERIDLEGAIAMLPDGYRQVVVLHDIEGMKHREIGQLLGIAEGTSKKQPFSARRALRKHLSPTVLLCRIVTQSTDIRDPHGEAVFERASTFGPQKTLSDGSSHGNSIGVESSPVHRIMKPKFELVPFRKSETESVTMNLTRSPVLSSEIQYAFLLPRTSPPGILQLPDQSAPDAFHSLATS